MTSTMQKCGPEIKAAALERGMEDFFAGDAAGEMIKQLIEDGEGLRSDYSMENCA